MPVGRICKAWQHLRLSKKRKAANESWLQWGSDEPQKQYEPSAVALSLNAPMVHAMYEEAKSLDTPVLQPLMKLASRSI